MTSFVMYSFQSEMKDDNYFTMAPAKSGSLIAMDPRDWMDFLEISVSTSVTYLRYKIYRYSPNSLSMSPKLTSLAMRARISNFKYLMQEGSSALQQKDL